MILSAQESVAVSSVGCGGVAVGPLRDGFDDVRPLVLVFRHVQILGPVLIGQAEAGVDSAADAD